MTTVSFFLVLFAAACAKPTPPRIVIIRQIVIETPNCEAPPLPMRAQIVGFPIDAPQSLSLAVTKSDGVEIRRELDGLRAVLSAISTCLTQRNGGSFETSIHRP